MASTLHFWAMSACVSACFQVFRIEEVFFARLADCVPPGARCGAECCLYPFLPVMSSPSGLI